MNDCVDKNILSREDKSICILNIYIHENALSLVTTTTKNQIHSTIHQIASWLPWGSIISLWLISVLC